MNVTSVCRKCDQPMRVPLEPQTPQVTCPACGDVTPFEPQEIADGQVRSCVMCGCKELFVRKDFSQRLGVMIVIIGLALSTIAWGFHWRYVSYAILFLTALIDLVLYFTVGNMLQCYRCQAEYRGLAGLTEFEPFDLETHERFRQQNIRLAQGKKV